MNRKNESESDIIARKADSLKAARKQRHRSAWYGLAMFGMVGWAVAVPMVAGVALGRWIDRRWPGDTSWTTILLLAGAVIGSLNAWHWVQRERRDDS